MRSLAAAASRHLVYASSSSVYGGNETLPFRVEDRVDHPLSLYAATKKADELMSETYAHLYRLPQTGLRFFTVYGPWGRPDMAMWLFTKAIFAGEPIQVFGEGDMRRDFTYVDDIVTGVVAALDNPPPDDGAPKAGGSRGPHRVYNIGNNRSEELNRMIDLIEQSCGRKAERMLMPMQPGDVRDTYADISAIQNDLGFAPTTSIDEGRAAVRGVVPGLSRGVIGLVGRKLAARTDDLKGRRRRCDVVAASCPACIRILGAAPAEIMPLRTHCKNPTDRLTPFRRFIVSTGSGSRSSATTMNRPMFM